MLRSILTLIAFILFTNDIYSQSFEWVKAFSGYNKVIPRAVVVDENGNVYSAGSFQGIADFDPGPGVYYMTAQHEDFYITKLDKDGAFLWVKSIVTNRPHLNNLDVFYGYIATNKSGDLYICGTFRGTVDLDPGAGVYMVSSAGHEDFFIVKLDTDGNFVWGKSIGDAGSDGVNSIAVDDDGNILLTGDFRSTVDFDPGPGIFNITALEHNTFILKLDSDGNFIWARSFEGNVNWGRSVSTDQDGNVVTVGHFKGSTDFDPGPGDYTLSSVTGWSGVWMSEDLYISKLDSDGNFLWAKSIGRQYPDSFNPSSEVTSVTTDLYGNVILTGRFYSSLDFDPGPGTFILHVDNTISPSNQAIFVLKLDPDGKFIWAKKMGGPYFAIGYSVKTDKRGNVYTAGWFNYEADFDPGPGSYILRPSPMASNNWGLHYFISKLDPNGDFVWAVSASDDTWPLFYGRSVFVDQQSNVYLTGVYDIRGDFDPGPDTFFLEYNGLLEDGFVLKLSQCQPTSDTARITACHSYTWLDGQTYTESTANATYIMENKSGCDSIITLDLTILKPDSTLVYHAACRSFEWNGDTLYQSGLYLHDMVNAEGCDSTVFLYLTIHEPDTVFVESISCDSYIWHDQLYEQSGTYFYDTLNMLGCDSTVMLNLTINRSAVTEIYRTSCDNYEWFGNSYTDSGIYEYKTQTTAGCDSTIYLNLTINTSDKITVSEFACHSYTWNGITYMESGTYMYNAINNAGCDSTLTLDLTILEHLENTDTINICEGDTIVVFGNPISTAGEISQTFTSVSGCDSTQTYIVTMTALPHGNIAASICEGDSILLYGSWFNEAGQYTVLKPNPGACDSLISIGISLLLTKYSFDTISLCKGDTLLLDGNIITTSTDLQTLLVSAESCDSIAHIHIAMLEPALTHRMLKLCPGDSILIAGSWISEDATVEEYFAAHNGCDSVLVTKISVIEEPDEPGYGIDCDTREVEVVIEAPVDWNILWDDGTEGPRTRYKDRSHATVVLTSIPDCSRSYTMDLPLIPDISIIKLPADTTIKHDIPLKISLDLDTSAWQFLWSPASIIDCSVCNEVVIKPDADTDVKLVLSHTSGCAYEIYFRITLETSEFSVPNIFTPDGDGINDVWKVMMPSGIELHTCQVFDRWGELVYHTNKAGQISWDGRFKGRFVPAGVYVFVIHYTVKGEKKVITGDITVIR